MRIHGFDLLRGLCAIMVAVYHMLYWTDMAQLYSWGLFGVYIFFVLSGASMVVAYRDRFARGLAASQFMLFRFARLAPLFVLVMALNLYLSPEVGRVLQNLSLLFGLGNPGSNSLVGGGWSIGIEFVYYLMFPVLLSLSQSRARLWIGALLVIVQFAFVHQALEGKTLVQAWTSYTQPLAFIAYFYLGCLIGHAVLDGKAPKGAALFIATFAAILLASGPSSEATLTGLRGVALFALVIAVVYFAAGVRAPVRLAGFLGDASYGTYLLHPFAYYAMRKTGAPLAVTIPVALAMTLIAAVLSFRFYELRVQQWVKKRSRSQAPIPVSTA